MKTKLALALCLLLPVLTLGCQNVSAPSTLPTPTLSPDSRLVALYFDDAYVNQYEQAAPVLLKYGFRATFAVITGDIGYGEGLTQCMDKKELQELAGHGMEIASHTQTHLHLTGNITDEQLRREIFDSKRDLEKLGFNVSTLAYPYYEYNEKVIEYTREAGYICARAGWSKEGVYDLASDDPLARYHIAATQISNQDIESFKLLVDKAGRDSVVCLVYHFITDSGPQETSTSIADFNAQMAYLHENGFSVVILSELLKQ